MKEDHRTPRDRSEEVNQVVQMNVITDKIRESSSHMQIEVDITTLKEGQPYKKQEAL